MIPIVRAAWVSRRRARWPCRRSPNRISTPRARPAGPARQGDRAWDRARARAQPRHRDDRSPCAGAAGQRGLAGVWGGGRSV